jgi:bifunctional non-homologous end joining protein LigD
LFFKEGTSDKEYHAQLKSHDDGWTVNFQYGRRGSVLRADSKTPQPLPYEEAKKIYDKVVREKVGKGTGLSARRYRHRSGKPVSRRKLVSPASF